MKKNHLPRYGVGPVIAGVMLLLTAAGIALSQTGTLPVISFGIFRMPVAVTGVLLIVSGIILWVRSVYFAKIDSGIKNNHLVTNDVYAWVRNPIYSMFLLSCTGAVMIYGNVILLVLPPVFWAEMTVILIFTEEKWLRDLYGEEYEKYLEKVNRCIPCSPALKRGKI